RNVLDALGPGATLERGYAIVTDGAGNIVRDAATLAPGDSLDTRVARGRIASRVESVEMREPEDGDAEGAAPAED
ncbi:MAG: exodeoxyribonuclease VII large subunit, partial [Gammaproteobacteria bacterium]